MEDKVLTELGVMGIATLYFDRVEKGGRVPGTNRTVIHFDQVTTIEFIPGTFWTPTGKIIFHASGLKRTRYVPCVGYMEFNDGEVTFNKKDNEKAELFFNQALKALNEYKAQKSISPERNDNDANNVADILLKYKALLDSGAITQAEFDAQKQALLKK